MLDPIFLSSPRQDELGFQLAKTEASCKTALSILQNRGLTLPELRPLLVQELTNCKCFLLMLSDRLSIPPIPEDCEEMRPITTDLVCCRALHTAIDEMLSDPLCTRDAVNRLSIDYFTTMKNFSEIWSIICNSATFSLFYLEGTFDHAEFEKKMAQCVGIKRLDLFNSGEIPDEAWGAIIEKCTGLSEIKLPMVSPTIERLNELAQKCGNVGTFHFPYSHQDSSLTAFLPHCHNITTLGLNCLNDSGLLKKLSKRCGKISQLMLWNCDSKIARRFASRCDQLTLLHLAGSVDEATLELFAGLSNKLKVLSIDSVISDRLLNIFIDSMKKGMLKHLQFANYRFTGSTWSRLIEHSENLQILVLNPAPSDGILNEFASRCKFLHTLLLNNRYEGGVDQSRIFKKNKS